MSFPLQFDRTNGLKVLKVLGYTVASSVIGAAVGLLPFIHLDPKYAAISGILFTGVNSGLVALQQWLGHQEEKLQ